MLIGVQTATLNAQVTFVNIAVAISALAGGALLKFSHRNPSSAGVFVIFGRFLCVGSEEGIEMEFWVVLGRFRQRKNGLGRLPATKKRTTMKKNCKYRCFRRIWDVRVLSTLQKPVFWTIFIYLYIEERVNYVAFEEKIETTL